MSDNYEGWANSDPRRWDPRVYPPYRTSLVTAPSEEPVSRTEAKLHCRVEHTADDTLIDGLIVASRQVVETLCRRALVTQTHDLFLGYWPHTGSVEIPNPPLVSVTTVKYYDGDGTLTTISSSDYLVSAGTPGSVTTASGSSWPEPQVRPDAIAIRYVAGYGAASAVPQCLKQAVLLLVGHFYENREAVAAATTFGEVPMAVDALIRAEAWGSY